VIENIASVLREKTLFIVPARGGSKGLPGKNWKELEGKPLINYSVEFAQKFTSNKNICVSTDSEKIIEKVNQVGLKVPFIRPKELAQDHSTSDEVLLHALNWYENQGSFFEYIVLLQPTSPFRKTEHLINGFELMSEETEGVISAFETKANPYYVLFEENEQGFLEKSKAAEISRRQDVPKVYELNGSIYILKVSAFKKYNRIGSFKKIIKNIMPYYYSVDIDVQEDWDYCKFILQNKLIELE
jgi:N-acylneuraminate cytidylyltransferase